jgi:hypothetical protein
LLRITGVSDRQVDEPLPSTRLGRFHALKFGVRAEDGHVDRESGAGVVGALAA